MSKFNKREGTYDILVLDADFGIVTFLGGFIKMVLMFKKIYDILVTFFIIIMFASNDERDLEIYWIYRYF